MVRLSCRRVSIVPLLLATISLVLIEFSFLTPCKITMGLHIKHSYRDNRAGNAFCTLNNNPVVKGSSDVDSCSSFMDARGLIVEHFHISYDECSYCCIEVSSNVTRPASASTILLRKTSKKFESDKPMIFRANHSSSQQMILNEIGIKTVFVINLDSRPDRLANVAALLGYLNFPFIRYSAIDVRPIHQQLNGLHPRTNFFRQILNRSHSYGQIGAWQSHLQVYFRIVDESKKDDRPVLILEDDVDMEVETPTLLKQALQSLPNNWEVFLAGHSHVQCTETNGTFCRVGHFFCTHAYIIRNASVASRIIDWSNSVHTQIADVLLTELVSRGSLIVYASYPRHIVVQDRKSFGSNIMRGAIPPVPLQRSLKKLLNP